MPIGEEGQHLRLAGAERWISPLDRRADAGSHPFALLRRSDVLDLTDEVQRQGLHLGGYGNDSIDGGSGTDVRIGEPGADTFSNCETQRERCQPPAGVGAPAEQVDPHPTHDRRRRSSRARSRSTPSAGRRRARVRLPARCTRSGGGHRRGGRARERPRRRGLCVLAWPHPKTRSATSPTTAGSSSRTERASASWSPPEAWMPLVRVHR
jgi:hypothetical protein